MSVATERTYTVKDGDDVYSLTQSETGEEFTYKNPVVTINFNDGYAIESEQGTAYLSIPDHVWEQFLAQGYVPCTYTVVPQDDMS